MSLAFVDRALDDFIQAADPRVLAVTGDWGRGKTFYWRSFLSRQSTNKHRSVSYAYISLFGLKDLRDVQDALVAGAVPIGDVSKQIESVAPQSLRERTSGVITRVRATVERKARSYSDVADKLPKLGEFGLLARAF